MVPFSEHPVAQSHGMGCAVACVAYRCGLSYEAALALFKTPEHAWTRGYFCSEVVAALATAGYAYRYAKYDTDRHRRAFRCAGTLVFVARCERYPFGHYLVRDRSGWMNPWINHPVMTPVKAANQTRVGESISFILFERVSR